MWLNCVCRCIVFWVEQFFTSLETTLDNERSTTHGRDAPAHRHKMMHKLTPTCLQTTPLTAGDAQLTRAIVSEQIWRASRQLVKIVARAA